MEKLRIVLVEDDDIIADFLVQRLTLENIDTVRYANGLDAVSGIRTIGKIDLILLDISLPDIDGFEVLKRIASFQEKNMVPVVVISNFSQEKDISWGKKLGVKQFVNKVSVTPIEIVNLAIDTIAHERAALARPRE